MACNGLKKGSIHLFRHPKWYGIILEKQIFDLFLTHFCPKTTHFQCILGC